MHDEQRRHLLLVIDHLQGVHEEWMNSDATVVTEPFRSAIEETVEVFGNGDLPNDCRELNARVEEMGKQWSVYQERIEASGNTEELPGNGFWRALEAVEKGREAARPHRRVQLESLSELKEQKVPDTQICKIYGWVDSENRPELWKLREEREKPGTHLGPDFVPPLERKRLEADAQREAYLKKMVERSKAKVERISAPAPESWEELFAQGLSARQLAKLKNCTLEEVWEKADELGVDRPAEHYSDPRMAGGGVHDTPLSEARAAGVEFRRAGAVVAEPDEVEVPDERGPLKTDDEVMLYHSQGMNTRQIGEAVGIPWQKVAAIIKARS